MQLTVDLGSLIENHRTQGASVRGKLLITSWGQVGILLPVSVHFPGTRKTGCWLTCHYVAVVLKRLIRPLKFLLIFREVWIQREREGDTERRQTPLSLPGDETKSTGCSVLSRVDSIFKKDTVLAKSVVDFAPLFWREAPELCGESEGPTFSGLSHRAQSLCSHIRLKQVMNY